MNDASAKRIQLRPYDLVNVHVGSRVFGPLLRSNADTLVTELALGGAIKVEVSSVN